MGCVRQDTVLLIPVYNERPAVASVIEATRRHFQGEVLVVDDGSTDGTSELLRSLPVSTVRHEQNRGYGAALRTGLAWAAASEFTWAITLDADRQHEPACIPHFLARMGDHVDVISGSRYLKPCLAQTPPPEDRTWVNRAITALIGAVTGYAITDAFCGFRAYRVEAVNRLELQQDGYGIPVEFWLKAWRCGLRVEELAVPLIYYDYTKGVGARPAQERLAHYLHVAAEVLEWMCSS